MFLPRPIKDSWTKFVSQFQHEHWLILDWGNNSYPVIVGCVSSRHWALFRGPLGERLSSGQYMVPQLITHARESSHHMECQGPHTKSSWFMWMLQNASALPAAQSSATKKGVIFRILGECTHDPYPDPYEKQPWILYPMPIKRPPISLSYDMPVKWMTKTLGLIACCSLATQQRVKLSPEFLKSLKQLLLCRRSLLADNTDLGIPGGRNL